MNKSMIAGIALIAGAAIAAPMLAGAATEGEPQIAQAGTPATPPAPTPPSAPGATGNPMSGPPEWMLERMRQGQPGGMPGGPGGMMPGPMRGRMGDGMREGRGDGMREGMRERMHGGMDEGMMHRSPKERCEEHIARRAGRIAYIVAKLNLTQEQRPLWDKLSTVLQGAQDRGHQLCASLPTPEQRYQQTILDRVNRREQVLSAKLQALQQAKQPLQALYQALTPEQKAIVDHPFQHGR